MRLALLFVSLLPLLAQPPAPDQRPVVAHEAMLGTLWMQHATEYRALTLQTYRAARRMLDVALADKSWTASLEQEGDFTSKPPAIILDIDETVLDNSTYEARQARNLRTFQPTEWRRWTSEKAAQPVPGAVELCQYAASKGVTVFFLSNRDDDGTTYLTGERADTLANLQQAGFPVSEERLLLTNRGKGWTSDKVSRRKFVAASYRVLLLFGDDLNDFVNVRGLNIAQRTDKARPYESYWGERWFALPNPTYGSFDLALIIGKSAVNGEQRRAAKEAQLETREP